MQFDKPNYVDYEDLIRVSFWKREMFMSKFTGAKIPFGTEIYVRIALQVTEETKDSLDNLISALIVFAILALCSFTIIKLLLFRLIKGGGGRGENMLMPIWMALNSLQLLVYLVLIDIPLPANSAYFMFSILESMRLRLFGLYNEDVFYSINEEQVQSYQGMIEGSNGYDRLHL